MGFGGCPDHRQWGAPQAEMSEVTLSGRAESRLAMLPLLWLFVLT